MKETLDPISNDDVESFHFLCPHNKLTEAVNLLQIISYYHCDDHSSCNLMNVLRTESWQIVSEYFLHKTLKNTPTDRSIYASSADARRIVYEQLSTKEKEQLYLFLKEVMLLIFSSHTKEALLTELVSAFENTIITNLLNITGEDFSRYYTPAKKARLLKMHKIDILRDVPGTQAIIQKIKEKQEKKLKQQLGDIFE